MGTQEETGVLDRFAGMPSSRGPSVGGGGGNGHTALLMSDFAAPDEEPVRPEMEQNFVFQICLNKNLS